MERRTIGEKEKEKEKQEKVLQGFRERGEKTQKKTLYARSKSTLFSQPSKSYPDNPQRKPETAQLQRENALTRSSKISQDIRACPENKQRDPGRNMAARCRQRTRGSLETPWRRIQQIRRPGGRLGGQAWGLGSQRVVPTGRVSCQHVVGNVVRENRVEKSDK